MFGITVFTCELMSARAYAVGRRERCGRHDVAEGMVRNLSTPPGDQLPPAIPGDGTHSGVTVGLFGRFISNGTSRPLQRTDLMTDHQSLSAKNARPFSAGRIGGLVLVALALIACGTAAAEQTNDLTSSATQAPTPAIASSISAQPSEPASPAPAASAVEPEMPVSTPVKVADQDIATASLALLATLPVKGRAPKTGYSREQFGQAWSDDVAVDGGHDGCNTRDDILRRDLTDVQIKEGTHGCVALSGSLADPYTAALIPFVRGAETSSDVQIDHVVALSDAWQSGAQQLTAEQRQDFGNDPLNLQATAGWVNQQKGAGDAATWLPPNTGYRCTFVARQVEVKAKYRLWVKPAERDAIAQVLGDCGAVATVSATDDQPEAVSTEAAPTAAPETAAAPSPADVAPLNPVAAIPESGPTAAGPFPNCAAARAAGAAPLHVGEPGYSTKLDRDSDGIACE